MGINFKITSTIFLGVSLLACLTPDSLSAQCLPGDVNQDGVVDCSDEQGFMAILATGGFQCEADINQDGAVDFLDIPLFNNLLPPCPCLLGDVNQDGIVDCSDEQGFMAILATGGFQCEADINQDGAVDFLDIPLFNNLLPIPPCLRGDVNRDMMVNFLDIVPFIRALGPLAPYQCEADINQDGVVDFLDIGGFIKALGPIPLPPCGC